MPRASLACLLQATAGAGRAWWCGLSGRGATQQQQWTGARQSCLQLVHCCGFGSRLGKCRAWWCGQSRRDATPRQQQQSTGAHQTACLHHLAVWLGMNIFFVETVASHLAALYCTICFALNLVHPLSSGWTGSSLMQMEQHSVAGCVDPRVLQEHEGISAVQHPAADCTVLRSCRERR